MTKPLDSLSLRELERHIRSVAVDSGRVVFRTHAKLRQIERTIPRASVLEVLRKGTLTRQPERNVRYGTLECRMERYVAGRNLAVIAAVSDEDPNVVVVTVMTTRRK